MSTGTAMDRALAAGRAIVAEGGRATGAAIRERAGVAMQTAVEAARVLRQERRHEDVEPEASEVPEVVTTAARQVWQTAVEAARAELAMDREAWTKQVRDAQAERDALAEELTDATAEVDRLAAEVETLTKRVQEADAHNVRLKAALSENRPAPAKKAPARKTTAKEQSA